MKSKSILFRFSRLLSKSIRGLCSMRKMMLKAAIYGLLVLTLYVYFKLSFVLTLLTCFAIYVATGGWKFLLISLATFPRDLMALRGLLATEFFVWRHMKNRSSVSEIWKKTWCKHPSKIACYYQDEVWTFKQLEDYMNKVANYFLAEGYKPGDVVALFMESRPQFICMWLGLSKIGVVTALINFNLREDSLAHCIQVSKARSLIFGAELSAATKAILEQLQGMEFHCSGGYSSESSFAKNMDQALISITDMPPPFYQLPKFTDPLFYIYTSGTTGLPKAAVISHYRFAAMAKSLQALFGLNRDDVIYVVMPLYHSAAGIVGVGHLIIAGTALAIRKKFSASNFWDDCIKYRATAFQYIGEICRYLLAQPVKPQEKQHRVRLCLGNGLRPQIWNTFKERFNIQRIGEFYGATEGNSNIANTTGKVGAVGFKSVIFPKAYPITLIKINEATMDPVRDSYGLCIECKPGEPGLLVGKIVSSNPLRAFDGYVNKSANRKKVCHDVFSKGDKFFMTGDVLVMDEYGYFFFRDRTGDTFRWRGENVSTTEVEAVISNIVGLKDVVSYGVEVPGAEGKAGMAAIVDPEGTVDLQKLSTDIKTKLPSYARPLFLRIIPEADQTGTYKFKKMDLCRVGFDPNLTSDKLLFMDQKSGAYVALTHSLADDICKGKIRL